MRNILSVDLEDWYHPELVRHHVSEPIPQLEESGHAILAMLASHGVKATFFTLGDVAQKHPGLIRAIAAQGHELASHGMTHKPLWELDAVSFGQELDAVQAVMNEITGGIPLYGYRAPTFSLDHRTAYALAVLAEKGYRYDSSIFPLKNHVYGMNDAPCAPYRIHLGNPAQKDASSPLIEFPMTVLQLWRIRIPVSGGFYLRVLPYWLLKPLLRHINRTRPFVIYFHPWEVARDTPRIRSLSLFSRFITYYGLSSTRRKLEKLLRDFAFAPMHEVIAELKL